MIFYFSGTGNSLYAAQSIAQAQHENLVPIVQEMKKAPSARTYALEQGELVGFVYPVYAWAPPEMVLDFIKTMQLPEGEKYIFSLNTCGGEEGNTTNMLQKSLMKRGLKLSSAFSIVMPNNYVIGSDLDSKEAEKQKLNEASKKLEHINVVLTGRQTGKFEFLKGSMPGLKTAIVNPLFNRFARQTKKFYATDACISCGLCEKICPSHTIAIHEKPVWGKACTQCLACINRCPTQAIQYGNATKGRGRYIHPIYQTEETGE